MTSMPIKHYTDLKTLLQEKNREKNNGKHHGFTFQAIMCKLFFSSHYLLKEGEQLSNIK